jgi:thymidylate synthase (FAD)
VTEIRFRSDVSAELIKSSASDSDVVFAARVSTVGATHEDEVSEEKTFGLINYLMRDRHGSPFEHTSFTFLIEAPIFVAREFMRHRAGWSYNETSGRYRELEPVFYIPSRDRNLVQVGKPGAYTFEPGSEAQHTIMNGHMNYVFEGALYSYRLMLDMGIAKEVARSVLPVGLFTSFYATCNARSLMHFLGLRTTSSLAKFPSFPQREIEMVAEQMEGALARKMPETYAAFNANGRVAP